MLPANSSSSLRPKVLIFKEDILPLSETFIKAQVEALKEFQAQMVGLGTAHPSLPVSGPPPILFSAGRSLFADYIRKVYRRSGIAPGFHRKAAQAGASLMHAHFASGGKVAVPLARYLKLPLLVTLHGADVSVRTSFAHKYRKLWENASLFLCVSEFIRQKALAAGFPADKLKVHYIGVDVAAFAFSPNRPPRPKSVVFVGRLVEKKGCEYLIRAMALVRQNHPDAELNIIGDGPLRPFLQSLASELNVSANFLLSQPSTAVRQWMARARVLCVPSITAQNGDSEGFGIVFAEAQAMGTPIVSSRSGGIPEVVQHGQTGLLAPERDFHLLASHISTFLDHQEFWNECSRRASEWVRRQFDLQLQTQHLEFIYFQLTEPLRLVAA